MEEHQQRSLKVKVKVKVCYLDVVFKAYVDFSGRMLEVSLTFKPGLCLAFVSQLRQKKPFRIT